jgi:hypothetical protein
MDTNTAVDLVVERLRQQGADIHPITNAPWINEIEHRLKLRFPASFRSLIDRYAFPLLDIGEVELFANEGDGSEYDLTHAPFRDPIMSPWLMEHQLIHIGHPYIGNYDPVCIDLSRNDLVETPIVQLNHEDILLERQSVRSKVIADNFLNLFERAIYVA